MLTDILITHIAQATDTRERHLRWDPEFCRLLDEGCDLDYLIDWVLEAQYNDQIPMTT
jgi:hypothetical protein